MNIIDVTTRPKKCPKCDGKICDILYGDPTPHMGRRLFKKDRSRAQFFEDVLFLKTCQIMYV